MTPRKENQRGNRVRARAGAPQAVRATNAHTAQMSALADYVSASLKLKTTPTTALWVSSEAKMVPVALVGLRVCLVMSEEPRVAVRPRFLRASRGCVVVCVYEYEIILTTSGPYFRKYFRTLCGNV